VSDIPAKGFQILTLGSQVVAHVAAPTVEKAPVAEAAPVEGAEAPEGAAGEKAAGESKGDDE
jgi:hypothetical protein